MKSLNHLSPTSTIYIKNKLDEDCIEFESYLYRAEENNQLKENKSHNQGDLKNGNNNINIDRKKSVENEKRIENNYEEERRSQAYRSTWKK